MKQAPMCDNYPQDEVCLVLWPSGRVQRYPSLAKAKTMLMRQHYGYIVCNIVEVSRYILDNEAHWYDLWKYDEGDLWQYLQDISEVRDPWAKAADIPDSDRITKRKTAAGYTIDHKSCQADLKMPKQAKIIAASFVEAFGDGAVVTDEDIEKHMRAIVLKGILNTKQEPMRIFTYYRKALLDKNCIKLRN